MNTSSWSSCRARWCSGAFALASVITIVSCGVLAAMVARSIENEKHGVAAVRQSALEPIRRPAFRTSAAS